MQLILFLLSLFLIFIIFIRIPKETLGLTTSVDPKTFSDSSIELERKLDIFTAICVLGYVIIVFKLNINA